MEARKDGDEVSRLAGEEMNAVSFVMDYVEFHFNGPTLRALTPPCVETRDGAFRFPQRGSRDALCSLIGSEVCGVDVRSDDRISLKLSGGQTLTIPLDDESRVSVEAAHFVPSRPDGTPCVERMYVW